jgi:CxxC-x17-CxxC domain-containing protein
MAYFKRGGKPNFKGGDRDSRPKTMHDATCSNCGVQCQVPFRPNGSKPVYCRDCFPKMTGSSTNRFDNDDHRLPRKVGRDFSSAAHRPLPPMPSIAPAANDDIKNELVEVNARLDRLIFVVENLATALTSPAKKKKSSV